MKTEEEIRRYFRATKRLYDGDRLNPNMCIGALQALAWLLEVLLDKAMRYHELIAEEKIDAATLLVEMEMDDQLYEEVKLAMEAV